MYQKVPLKLTLFVFGFFAVCNAIDIKMIAHRKGFIGYGDECRMANCKNVKEDIWRDRASYASRNCGINCGFNDACKETQEQGYKWSSNDCGPSKCACNYIRGTWEGLDDCRSEKGFDGLSCSHIKQLFIQQY